MSYDMLTILGPTASGKTGLAANLAYLLKGEILSADSRQVYRNMDLGTGKDYADYIVKNEKIPYHLVDIVDAGYKYNIYEYQNDFLKEYKDILSRNKFPVLCGGSGMYIEAVLKEYKLIAVPVDEDFRESCNRKEINELIDILKSYTNQ
jgi:tRNA dimethylallyltransferase